MTAARLLHQLQALWIELWVDGEQLRYRAPKGAFSDELRELVSRDKPELIRLFRQAAGLLADAGLPSYGDDDLPQTPNHKWYLDNFDPELHKWAITLAIKFAQPVLPSCLRASAERLIKEHDIFRLRLYKKPDGRWANRLLPTPAPLDFSSADLSTLDPAAQSAAVHAAGHRVQSSLSIIAGPVIAMALCQLRDPGPDLLIIALHHHMADAYSLGLLVSELLQRYQAMADAQLPSVRSASSTYREFLLAIQSYTHSLGFMARALAFWQDPDRLRVLPPLPVDMPGGRHTDINSRQIKVALTPTLCTQIGRYIEAHDDVSQNDVLLFAIALGYYRWTGRTALRIDCEHNGRTGLLPDVDLIRTMGATTIKFPLLLEFDPQAGAQDAFVKVRRIIRETSQNALGYGLLRYHCSDPTIQKAIAACAAPQVFFNNRATVDSGRSPLRPEHTVSFMEFPEPGVRENPVTYDLIMDLDLLGDAQVLTGTYSSASYQHATMRAFFDHVLAALTTLVASEIQSTPSSNSPVSPEDRSV